MQEEEQAPPTAPAQEQSRWQPDDSPTTEAGYLEGGPEVS